MEAGIITEKKRRIISPEPRLANILRQREPIFINRENWDWTIDWIQDIGVVMRDRSFISYTIASSASYGILIAISEFFPTSKKMGLLSKALGIAEK